MTGAPMPDPHLRSGRGWPAVVMLARLAAGLLLLLSIALQPAAAADSNVTVKGLSYFVRDSGGNGAVVLMLHGMPDDGSVWDVQAAALARAGYRVIVPDLVGYGLTDKPEALDRYRLASMAPDLDAILAARGIVGPVHVVGHDWGGALAWEFVYDVPGRTRSLAVLTTGHPAVFAKESLNFKQSRWNWYMFMNALPDASTVYRAADGKLLRGMLLDSHPQRDAVTARLLQPGGIEAVLRWDRANPVSGFMIGAATGELAALPPVDVPVFGIAGADDVFLWPSQVSNSRDYVKGSFRYAEVKGAGHWLMLDHPDEVNSLLLDWLANQTK